MDYFDDPFIPHRNRSIDGGINNWGEVTDIKDNQASYLTDVDIDSPGLRKKRLGYAQVGDTIGTSIIGGLNRFAPAGGTELLMIEIAGTVYTWDGSAATLSSSKAGLASVEQTRFVPAYNRLFRLAQGENVWSFDGSTWTDEGNADTNVPRGLLGIWTSNNRFLVARTTTYPDYVYYSASINPQSFIRSTNAHKLAAGDNSPIFGMLEWTNYDVIVWKKNRILALTISDTTPANWPIYTVAQDIGCVAPDSVANLGEDVLFLDIDGVRSLVQSAQDKKRGGSLPLSMAIKWWIDKINWQYAYKACAKVWNNRYMLAVPMDTSTYNNYVLVYNQLTNGWTVYSNWNVNCWAQADFGTTDKLYFGNSNANGKVYRGGYGTNDDGTAITSHEETKALDFGDPAVDKIGGSFELEAKTDGGTNLSIYASVNEGGWTLLGTLDLTGTGPKLPISLPFTLVAENIIRTKVTIQNLGRFRNIKFKFTEDTLDKDCKIRGWFANARLCEFEREG